METIPINLPAGTENVIRESNSALQLAQYMVVEDQDSYETACQAIIDWKDKIKQRLEFFRPIKQAMDVAKKIVLDKEKDAIGPLQKAIDLVQPRALTWKHKEEQKAEAERRRIEEEERKREEERRIEEAARLEKNGEEEAAQALISQPIETPIISVAPAVAKVMGLSATKRFDFEIIDAKKINHAYLIPDGVKIRKQVMALGFEAAELVGGIRVFAKESFIRRT